MSSLPDIQRDPFIQALTEHVLMSHEEDYCLGLLLIDLNNLSDINHTRGFDIGDLALAVIHQKLMALSKLADTVFRIGSGRFAFLLPELSNPGFIALAVNKVTSTLGGELMLAETPSLVDVRIGVGTSAEGSSDPLNVLANAERNLHSVKRGHSLPFDNLLPSGSELSFDSRRIQQFSQALRENSFELYFQPKIRLADGVVHGAEALLRWQASDGEYISPEVLVLLAGRLGRGFDLTKWVVNSGLRTLKEWQHSMDIGLALNIQAGLISNRELVPLLQDSMAIWSIEPDRLTIEITEDAIIEDKEAGLSNLLKIKESGIKLSIDDFGTGYSSMSYFKHIPATELKIDRSFVSSMLDNTQDQELVKIMIQIAREFGLTVVAEGVEDVECARRLKELGCDYAQGYYFSRPLPKEEFEDWMSGWSGLLEP